MYKDLFSSKLNIVTNYYIFRTFNVIHEYYLRQHGAYNFINSVSLNHIECNGTYDMINIDTTRIYPKTALMSSLRCHSLKLCCSS